MEPIIQSEVSQKGKYKYRINAFIWNLKRREHDNPIWKTVKETQM